MNKALIALTAILVSTSCVSQNKQQENQLPMNQTTLTLNNGVVIPQFGLGVYSIPAGETTYNSVLAALKAGYRHIDTAHAYGNERSVGEAVRDSGIPRDSIWITSKLWPNEYGEEITPKQLDKMLDRLGLEYLDLVYLHQPLRDYNGGWKALEAALDAGKVRAIGISDFDFDDDLFNSIVEPARIKPQMFQIECHPYAQREHWQEMAKKYNIQIECWFPLVAATATARSSATRSSTLSPRPTASPPPRSSSAGTCRKASAWFPAPPTPSTSRRTSRSSTSS